MSTYQQIPHDLRKLRGKFSIFLVSNENFGQSSNVEQGGLIRKYTLSLRTREMRKIRRKQKINHTKYQDLSGSA
jgi:hypothetical protein